MKKSTFILFLLLVGLFSMAPNPCLSQDDYDDMEELFSDDDSSPEDEPIPWQQNPDDSYVKESIQRTEGAQDTWKKYHKKMHFSQEIKKKKKKSKDELNQFTGKGMGEALKWILIVVGILLIIGFIVYLVQDGSFRQGKKIKVDISEEKLNWIEENLPEADVVSPLESAIDAQEYRKAIRLYFLLIVQRLSQAGAINWQKEKTNRTYILETYNKDFHQDFKTCVRIYERVWYGERTVSEEEFWKIEPIFKQLAANIPQPLETTHEE